MIYYSILYYILYEDSQRFPFVSPPGSDRGAGRFAATPRTPLLLICTIIYYSMYYILYTIYYILDTRY